MTNGASEPTTELAQGLRALLASHGIEDTRGIEILRLVRLINNAYDSVLGECTQDERITPHRWRVLWRIWMEEQMGRGPVNPTLISRSEHVSKNTISDHLRGLEEAGLIERTLDREDRRQFNIVLTPAGRDLIVRSTPAHFRQMNQVLDGFSPEDVVLLHALLSRLHRALLTDAADAARNC
jgi:DNA-binding MarR family transcriptional regulator